MPGLYALSYDQSNCDREPIHVIRAIQSFAALLAFDRAQLQLVHASENAERMLGLPDDFASRPLPDLLSPGTWERLQRGLEQQDFTEINPIEITALNGRPLAAPLYLIAHENRELLILEFEAVAAATRRAGFFSQMDRAIQQVQRATALPHLFRTVVRQVRALTGFDRVMLYRFDADYNGEVIAEDRREDFEPYLNLRYPASDIPRQARELYLRNPVRVIADIAAEPVLIQPPLHPATGEPLDLTYSVARAVSPVHLRYLQNMGVGATMSIAIIVDNRLWGLIACHHATPLRIDYRQRQFIRFVGTVVSGHLALQAVNQYRNQVLEANLTRRRLLEQLKQDEDIVSGLTQHPITLLDLNEARGGALLVEDQLYRLGETPPEADLRRLRSWLDEQEFTTLFHTDSLSKLFPAAAEYAGTAAGLMALRIPSAPADYVLWFKPEVHRTIHWGGNPTKTYERMPDGSQRLSPRSSFAKWTEQVRQTSAPWTKQERDFAVALHEDLRDIVVQQYRQVRDRNQELTASNQELESFSYSVSHDLRAPLRSIEGFTQILRDEYSDRLDEYGRQILQTIIGSARKMNELIEDMLAFSQLGSRAIHPEPTDLAPIIRELETELLGEERSEPPGAVRLQYPAPLTLVADPALAYSLLQNLLSNAIKYTRGQADRTIRIDITTEGGVQLLSVADNGIGFDPRYADRIFEVFTRLVSDETFEGTGVGLATVRRIMKKHDGRVWADSEPGVGTTFYCEFPLPHLNRIVS